MPAEADPAELRVEGVSHRYEDGPLVLQSVGFLAAPGDSIAILGPSGSGKSTLLNIIGSLQRPTSGRVHLGQIDVTSLAGPALSGYRARSVGFIFQDHLLLPHLTAQENVLIPTLAMKSRADAAAGAEHLLAAIGLSGRQYAFPWQLSGGERQRVALARALINSPPLLLCDEPTGNLDTQAGQAVAHLLLETARTRRTIVLLVTHNRAIASLCDRAMELSGGRLHELAAPGNLAQPPEPDR